MVARIRARRSRRWRVSIADTELDDDSDFAETHEINVTPFIDVILVLLDHLHGGGAAVDRRSSDRSADVDRDSAEEAGQADLCQHQAGSRGGDRRNPGQAASIWFASLDAMADASKDRFIFLRADRAGALRRADGRAGNPARGRLLEDQAGGAGRRSGTPAAPPAPETQSPERLDRRCPTSTPNKNLPGGCGFSPRWARLRFTSAAARSRSRICRPTIATTRSARRRSRSGSELMSPRHRSRRDLPPGPDTDASRGFAGSSPSRRPRSRRPSCRRTSLTEADDPDRVVTPNDPQQAQGGRAEDRRGADQRLQRNSVAAEATATPSSRRPSRKAAALDRSVRRAPVKARGARASPGRRS